MGRSSKVKVGSSEVTAVVDGPRNSDTLFFMAPGAGSGIHSDFMSYVADAIVESGVKVCRFNFPYLEAGRKTPDRAPILEDTYRAVVESKSKGWEGAVFIGGKSMGGRIASQVAATGLQVDGLVYFGYPLHPPGRPERLRDQHLYEISAPMLFIEGTRDPFCPLKTLDKVRAKIDRADLAVIDDGDHSFKVRRSSGRSTSDAWLEVAGAATDWMEKLHA